MPSNMDLAAKLAERIRTSELGEWIDEEDLREIGKEAIKLAFLKGTPGSYNSAEQPSVLVRVMRDTFEEKIKELMAPVIAELAKDEDFIKLMTQQMVLLMPKAIENAARNLLGSSIFAAQNHNTQQLQTSIGDTISRLMQYQNADTPVV